MATLHVHLDESGNFVFTPKGTEYYIFTAVWTYNPAPLADALSRARFRFIKEGRFRDGVLDDLSGFHACDDPKPRRRAFIKEIMQFEDWNFASLVVEKNKLNPTLHEPNKFYAKFLNMVLKFVLKGRVQPDTQQVLIYTDTLPMSSRKEATAVNTSIQEACNLYLASRSFRIMHHSGDSNYWIQVADYCSWAMNRKWQNQDETFYDLLRPRLAAPEIAPMSRGNGVVYY